MAKRKATATKQETKKSDNGNSGNWFSTGKDGFEKKKQIDKANKAKREKWVPRFYLKSKAKAVNTEDRPNEFGFRDDAARVVFLDNDGFFIHEHSIKIDGKWGNNFTCVKEHRPCPICTEKDDRAGFVGFFTVIDTRKWRKKDGTVSEPGRKLFPAKGDALALLESIRKKKGDLTGLVIDIVRIGDKTPNCGSHFEVAGRISEAKLKARFGGKGKEDNIQPFDYMKVLAPPTEEEYYEAGCSGGSGGAIGDDADVDFDDDAKVEDTMSDEDVDGLLDD